MKIIIILILFIILVGLSFANVTLCENYISMNEPQVSIVVARYNEDVKWLNDFDTPIYKVFLYNKGKPLNANEVPSNVVQIDLPNVGREAHTYLYHIVSNYSNLTPYLVFLQGHPFDHITTDKSKPIKSIVEDYIYSNESETIYCFDYYHEPVDYYRELHIRDFIRSLNLCYQDSDMSTFARGAQYIVKNTLIINKDKTFYSYLYDLLTNDYNNRHPNHIPFSIQNLNAYTMERIWPLIFSKKSHQR